MTNAWTAELEPELEQERPRQQTPRNAISPSVEGSPEQKRRHAYIQSALQRETDNVRNAGRGTRNHALNRAAYALGQLAQHANENTIVMMLDDAAKEAGLPKHERTKTIASGLNAGKKEPRDIPPPEERVTSDVTYDDLDQRVDDFEPGNDSDADPARPAPDAREGQERGQQPRALIQLIDAESIFAPLEEPVYVVDQVIRQASVTEMVGYGGGSKTWQALAMVVDVASGRPWLGRFAVKQGPTVYLDYENGQYEMRRRAQALKRGAQLESVPNMRLGCMPSVYMSSDKFGAAVEAIADGCSLLVVDTLRAANPGTDENDSNMRVGIDALRRVGEKTGCAFLVLVHSKKTSGSVLTVDPREAGRGSSAIYDAADTVLHVTYTEGEPLRIQQTKARLGRPLDPFLVSITDTENGGVLVVASDDAKQEAASSADKFEAVCARVLAAVRDWPGSSGGMLREKLGVRNQTVSAALDRLARDGAVRNAGSSRDAKWFPLGPGGVSND